MLSKLYQTYQRVKKAALIKADTGARERHRKKNSRYSTKVEPVTARGGNVCKSDGHPYAFFVAASLHFSMAVNNFEPLLHNTAPQH